MGPKYDFPDVDWANEDIKILVDTFSEKFAQMEKEKDTIIAQQSDRIKQLEQEIAQLKSTGRHARKSRSYNTRDLKDYPRPPDTANRRPAHAGDAVGRDAGVRVIRRTADIRCCPMRGAALRICSRV